MKNRFKAFSLAELLIALIVIGIVASITIPSLLNNNRDKQLATAKTKLNYTISNILMRMSVSGELGTQTSSSFFEKFSRHGHFLKTCDISNINDCFTKKIKNDNNEIEPSSLMDEHSKAFVTSDGISMILKYKEECTISDNSMFKPNNPEHSCLTVIADLNGRRAPNKVNTDIIALGDSTIFTSLNNNNDNNNNNNNDNDDNNQIANNDDDNNEISNNNNDNGSQEDEDSVPGLSTLSFELGLEDEPFYNSQSNVGDCGGRCADLIQAMKDKLGYYPDLLQTVNNFFSAHGGYLASHEYDQLTADIIAVGDQYYAPKAQELFGKIPAELTEEEMSTIEASMSPKEREEVLYGIVDAFKQYNIIMNVKKQ